MSDVFTLMGGKDWLKDNRLELDGTPSKNAVGFIAQAGRANRIGVQRKEINKKTVYLLGWYRFDSDSGDADELRADQADTAKEAAEMIEASLREKVKARKSVEAAEPAAV